MNNNIETSNQTVKTLFLGSSVILGIIILLGWIESLSDPSAADAYGFFAIPFLLCYFASIFLFIVLLPFNCKKIFRYIRCIKFTKENINIILTKLKQQSLLKILLSIIGNMLVIFTNIWISYGIIDVIFYGIIHK